MVEWRCIGFQTRSVGLKDVRAGLVGGTIDLALHAIDCERREEALGGEVFAGLACSLSIKRSCLPLAAETARLYIGCPNRLRAIINAAFHQCGNRSQLHASLGRANISDNMHVRRSLGRSFGPQTFQLDDSNRSLPAGAGLGSRYRRGVTDFTSKRQVE